MPPELLPTVVTSLQDRIEVGFPLKSDQTGLLVGFLLYFIFPKVYSTYKYIDPHILIST